MASSDGSALSSSSSAFPDVASTASVIISYVVNPLVVPPLVFALVLAHVGAPALDFWLGIGIVILFLTLIPLAHVGWLRMRGLVESLEVRDRTKRTGPLLVGLAAGLTAWGVLLNVDLVGGPLLAALVICHLVNTGVILAVTHWWKISIHCSATGGAAAILLFVAANLPGTLLVESAIGSLLLLLALLLMPLLAWARVRSRAHTVGQVVAGTTVGFLLSYGELLLLARFSLL